MDTNPYAAPAELPADIPAPIDPKAIRVQAPYLVVRARADLPDRCVISNVPTSEKERRKYVLNWAPSFRLVLTKNACRVMYTISAEHRRKKFRQGIVALVVVLSVIASLAMWWMPLETLLYTFLVFAVVGVGKIREAPLKIKFVRHGWFWLSGCGAEFLQSCEQEFGTFEGPL